MMDTGHPAPCARILVADDHEDTRVILRHYFEAMGFEVREARDGEETLAELNATLPDAVVLDIQMPKMDGIAVLRAVREDGALRQVPILALSAHALADEVRQIRDAGADAYLSKPADPKSVVAAVRELIERRPSSNARSA
jgi:two-component system cell cycle response regulator DivK